MRPHRMLEARTNNVPSCFQRTWCFVAKIAHKIIQHPWFHPQKINHNQVLQLETHIHTMRTIYSHMCFLESTNSDGWRKEPLWGLDWHALLLRGLKGINRSKRRNTPQWEAEPTNFGQLRYHVKMRKRAPFSTNEFGPLGPVWTQFSGMKCLTALKDRSSSPRGSSVWRCRTVEDRVPVEAALATSLMYQGHPDTVQLCMINRATFWKLM